MKTILYGQFKQGLYSGSTSHAVMIVSPTQLKFDVGLFFRNRFEFSPEEIRRFQRTDRGLRIYHNKTDCLSPIVFKVALFKSQNLALRSIKRAGFVPRGRMKFEKAN